MSTRNTFRVSRYVALGAFTALAFGAAAHAGDKTTTDAGVPQTVVNYSDLDLSRASDVRELYSRLRSASDTVCSEYRDSSELRMHRLYRSCFQDALSRAVRSVDHPAVTAMLSGDRSIRVARHSGKGQSST
ncbi:MAG TPA: UrcA family protein [Steroidobacter sp.]|uniref:UrcA family protein n=1 Tax=Steroidobacter sp. TaxID=1978227 RepID=UPI002ED859A4